MKSKLFYFVLGAAIVTLIYFLLDDIKRIASIAFREDIFNYILLGITLINTSLIVYALKINSEEIDNE